MALVTVPTKEKWDNLGAGASGTFQETDAYKRDQMKMYQAQYGLENFIETGTYLGGTVEAMRHSFKTVYSTELDLEYYNNLIKKFSGMENVHLMYGDSAVLLPELLDANPNLTKNTLFWLDAHAGNPFRAVANPPQNYRGLIGVGKYDFSGLIELEYLLSKNLSNCVILVDDITAGGDGCLHNGCGCEYELMRIVPHAVIEMCVARVICP
jgi:hypothetical protein